MNSATTRADVVSTISKRSVSVADPFDFAKEPTGELFGCNTFNLATMEKVLSTDTYTQVLDSVERGGKLDKLSLRVLPTSFEHTHINWVCSK